ncbi:MAG: phosphatidate cytidylyltransferase [Pseudomonadota bacterium]
MLKRRLITAAVLIPIFVLLVLKLPPLGFAILTSIFTLIGAWEWSGLLGLKDFLPRLCYPIFICGILSIPVYVTLEWVMLGALIFWLLALVLVVRYPKATHYWGNSLVVRSLMGCMVFVPTLRALIYLRSSDIFGANNGPSVVLFIFVLIWCADSGAYFAGNLWGKTKLAPAVSPGKTWQGLAGALAAALLLAPILMWLLPAPQPALPVLILLTIITVGFSVLGDLFESMLKRNVGLKDSGGIFPGHGGLLDRVDSLTAAAPIFTLGCLLMLKLFH